VICDVWQSDELITWLNPKLKQPGDEDILSNATNAVLGGERLSVSLEAQDRLLRSIRFMA
jgi:hypothetical protein